MPLDPKLQAQFEAIPLTQGRVARVCLCHYASIKGYSWHFDGQYAANKTKKKIYMHRLIMSTLKEVDHINLDKLDNRCMNLRPATRSQNSANVTRSNLSGFKGVQRNGNKWRAYIGGKPKTIGYFDTPQEAAKAYDLEAMKMYGEYARLNYAS